MLLLVPALLPVACGGQPATPASEPATEDATPASEEAIASRGTFRFGFNNRFLTWDRHQEQRPIALMGYQLVYDALLSEDLAGNPTPGPATAWSRTVDALELTLREGVVFHDGTPFDAEVAQANLLRVRDEGAPPIAQHLAAVESIDLLDSHRIRLNLSRPAPDLLNNPARSAGMIISPEAFDTAAERPVGTESPNIPGLIDSATMPSPLTQIPISV